MELRRRLCLTSIPALLVQRKLHWFGHAARRPEVELIMDLLLPTPPAEDLDNHDQGTPGTPLRPRTMEKGLGESL